MATNQLAHREQLATPTIERGRTTPPRTGIRALAARRPVGCQNSRTTARADINRARRAVRLPRPLARRRRPRGPPLGGRGGPGRPGERRDCPAGTCALLPRGREHSFSVESDEARLLVILVPAGMEGHYRDRGCRATGDLERLVTEAAGYGVAIAGPAPGTPTGQGGGGGDEA